MEVLHSMNIKFIEIKVPDDNCQKPKHQNKKINIEYMMIIFACNEEDNEVGESSKWTPRFTRRIKRIMKVSLSGTSKKNKHHGSRGLYYGFGLISKYNIRRKLSVYEFSGGSNEKKEKRKQLLEVLRSDIEYTVGRQHRALPDGIYLGFLVMSSMVDIILNLKNKCKEIITLLSSEGVSSNMMCSSNWVCKDAETTEFHQELDSSYTCISVPFWNHKALQKERVTKGNANFIFRWNDENFDGNSSLYLPIWMNDGLSLLFSGFGCYHRQHKTDNHKFWNLSTYQNRSFFQKLRSSIIRCVHDNC